MNFIRILRIALGTLAGLILTAALGDILLSGRLSLISPASFGALVAVALAFLIQNMLVARKRGEALARHSAQLKTVASRLEASLGNAAAMNARLNQSEARYKGLVDAQGDAIFRRDATSRLTYANDAFFKLFGLNPARAIGYPFAPELHPDSRAPMFGSFAGLESGHARVRYDQHVRTAYGYRWIAWEDYAVRDIHGRLVEVQSVGRDINERKALEDALTEARDRAEAGSRAKSGFLATMSYEIRTPMNGVLGMGRLLLETDLRPEQHTYARAITESGEALLTLIGDILDFSKIESGTLTLDEDEVEIRGLVAGVVELLGPRAHAKNIEIAAIIDHAIPAMVRADVVRLRQVLTNLMGNAVKFTEKGGICVEAKLYEGRERNFLRFEVRDTGVGIPAAKRQEIFLEFVQADSSHARKFGGSGLGLAISKRLVEAMGGQIGVDPLPGGGSAFWFTLPALVIEPAPEISTPLAGLKISVVTRNAILREGLTALIHSAGGELTRFAVDGADEQKPDAVIIDAGTDSEPDPPAHPDPEVPALVLVTPAARGKLAQLKAMGFAGYLVKPVRQASLIERLLICRNPALQGEMLQGDAFAAAEQPAPPPVVAETLPPPAAPPSTAGRRLNILLAEDNPINALLIRELLRRRGHKITEVTTGTAAVEAMENATFDLLLTDIHMPGMDGIEAARAIRASEERNFRPRTPIVALTADALETGKRACQDAGMDGFLTKPVDPAEVEEMFEAIFPAAFPSGGTRDAAA